MATNASTAFGSLGEALREAGLVDTHYHVGPELLPRRYDVATLATAARPWNATVVLKNHTYCTTPLAALARAHHGVRFLGSVVLNRFVGGLNPDAVIAAVSGNRSAVAGPAVPGAAGDVAAPIVVWMPTVHAAAHLRALGRAFDPRWSGQSEAPGRPGTESEAAVEAFDDELRPTRQLLAVLDVVARTGCRLATGHLSANEIMALVPLALEIGVPGVLITHPHYPSVGLSDDQLVALTRSPRVFIEHCFAIHTIEKVPLEAIAASIRTTGPDQVVVASDFGQVCSQPFPDGTAYYAAALEELLKGAIGRADVVRMFGANGARALGLETT